MSYINEVVASSRDMIAVVLHGQRARGYSLIRWI